MTLTHLLTLLLISTGAVLTGLSLMQERAEPLTLQEARAQTVETRPAHTANTTLPGNQDERQKPPQIQVLNTQEQRHVATRNTCDVRCHSAGALSHTVLAELCNLDTTFEQTLQSPLYHRLLIVLMLHPQAEAHMDDVAAEVRGNVDCADQAKWGTNTHIALLQRGILDSLSTLQIEE